MSTKANPGVPKSLFVIILALLTAMCIYAVFFDYSEPEKTVNDFYTAYFGRDFDIVAENLSVFWSVRFLPQYGAMQPAELLANRDTIEKETSKVIAYIEEDKDLPENLNIEILKDYTKTGKNSALVVYNFKEDGKVVGIEAAILIKENGSLRIFNMAPISTEDLETLKNYDITVIDENFQQLIKD